MVKKLLCVSYGSLKRFPHTFTTSRFILIFLDFIHDFSKLCNLIDVVTVEARVLNGLVIIFATEPGDF